jgi:hypothetical protein
MTAVLVDKPESPIEKLQRKLKGFNCQYEDNDEAEAEIFLLYPRTFLQKIFSAYPVVASRDFEYKVWKVNSKFESLFLSLDAILSESFLEETRYYLVEEVPNVR